MEPGPLYLGNQTPHAQGSQAPHTHRNQYPRVMGNQALPAPRRQAERGSWQWAPRAHRGSVLRTHVVVVPGLGAVGLAAVGTGEGGAVHLAGRFATAPLVVLVAHEAGEGGPTALGGQSQRLVSGQLQAGQGEGAGWALALQCPTDLLGAA